MNIENYVQEIDRQQILLQQHALYAQMTSIEDMKQFMQVHVFAVWDFMSLLKRLQNDITCMSIPWMPSRYSKKAVRLINEIVVGEESDECPNEIHPSGYCDHFTMYRLAMRELGINDLTFFEQLKHLNLSVLPSSLKEFLAYHLKLAAQGTIEQVAGSFLFGRERLLPSLFIKVVEQINNEAIDCPALKYYLERHIEVDGDHHSHMAQDLFNEICDTDEKRLLGYEAALTSLKFRNQLWDQACQNIQKAQNSAKKSHEKRPSLS